MYSSKDYHDNVDNDFNVSGGDIDDIDSDNILDHGNINSLEIAAQDAALTDGLITNPVAKANLEMKTKKLGLRRGKWTPEEEYYANRLIQEFKSGLLPLTDGTTLRTFLSKLLNCDPMRISKKFVGQNCIGKQVFRRRQQDLDKLTSDQVERSRRELADLERKFLERVAQTNRTKTSSGSVKPLKENKLYDENTGMVAPWMRQPDDFKSNDMNTNNNRYPPMMHQQMPNNQPPNNHNMYGMQNPVIANNAMNFNPLHNVGYDQTNHMLMNQMTYNQYDPSYNIMKYEQEARQSSFGHGHQQGQPFNNKNIMKIKKPYQQPNETTMESLNNNSSHTNNSLINNNNNYAYKLHIKQEDEKLLNNRITSLDVLYSLDGMDSIPTNLPSDNNNNNNNNNARVTNKNPNKNISQSNDYNLMNNESNLQAILAWPSMSSLITADEAISNEETNKNKTSENQQLMSGLSGLQSLSSVALQEFETIASNNNKSNAIGYKRSLGQADDVDDKSIKRSTVQSNSNDDGYFIGEEESSNQQISNQWNKSIVPTNNNKNENEVAVTVPKPSNQFKETMNESENLISSINPFASARLGSGLQSVSDTENPIKIGKHMAKNSSVENFWMLVQMGDLPRPESGTLTQTIWNGGKPQVVHHPYMTSDPAMMSKLLAPISESNINSNRQVFLNQSSDNNHDNNVIKSENSKD